VTDLSGAAAGGAIGKCVRRGQQELLLGEGIRNLKDFAPMLAVSSATPIAPIEIESDDERDENGSPCSELTVRCLTFFRVSCR
jgi:hypothetical protein